MDEESALSAALFIRIGYDLRAGYPVDRLMHDIALALMAVQTQTTDVLSDFPTKAAEATPQTETPATA